MVECAYLRGPSALTQSLDRLRSPQSRGAVADLCENMRRESAGEDSLRYAAAELIETIVSHDPVDVLRAVGAALGAGERDGRAVDWGGLIAKLDAEHGGRDECSCELCERGIGQAVKDGWSCEFCGYSGRPYSFSCACYDTYRDSLRRCYCAGVYQCTRCLRYFGWCAGAALGDGRDEWCDECWDESERVAGGT